MKRLVLILSRWHTPRPQVGVFECTGSLYTFQSQTPSLSIHVTTSPAKLFSQSLWVVVYSGRVNRGVLPCLTWVSISFITGKFLLCILSFFGPSIYVSPIDSSQVRRDLLVDLLFAVWRFICSCSKGLFEDTPLIYCDKLKLHTNQNVFIFHLVTHRLGEFCGRCKVSTHC